MKERDAALTLANLQKGLAQRSVENRAGQDVDENSGQQWSLQEKHATLNIEADYLSGMVNTYHSQLETVVAEAEMRDGQHELLITCLEDQLRRQGILKKRLADKLKDAVTNRDHDSLAMVDALLEDRREDDDLQFQELHTQLQFNKHRAEIAWMKMKNFEETYEEAERRRKLLEVFPEQQQLADQVQELRETLKTAQDDILREQETVTNVKNEAASLRREHQQALQEISEAGEVIAIYQMTTEMRVSQSRWNRNTLKNSKVSVKLHRGTLIGIQPEDLPKSGV